MGIEQISKTGDQAPPEWWAALVESSLDDAAERVGGALRRILPDIRAGAYGVVLGIDASGRVPALMTWQVLNKYHKVPLRFLAGRGQGRLSEAQQIAHADDRYSYFSSNFYKSIEADKKKVLIVDDTIATGGSIKPTCDALTKHGIRFDVVAAGGYFSSDDKREQMEALLRADRLAVGGEGAPRLYSNHEMGGVQKEVGSRHASPTYKAETDDWSDDDTTEMTQNTIPDASKYGVSADDEHELMFEDEDDDAYFWDDSDNVQNEGHAQLAYTRKRLHEYSDQIFQKLEAGEQTN